MSFSEIFERIRHLISGYNKATKISDERFVNVGEGYCKTSVNTCIFRTNSLITYGEIQYIAYYDRRGRVVLGKRHIGSDKWKLKRTRFRANVKDAHNVISLGTDGEGYLHIAFGMHATRLNYSRSVLPGSLKMLPLHAMTGEDEEKCTYPEFYLLPSGDLLFAYRSGKSGNGNMVLKRYDVKDKSWRTVNANLLDGEGERNAYWQAYLDKKGTFHLSWVWRETADVATNHDLCYAKSDDGGMTWKKSDGTFYTLPITLARSEIAWKIPQKSELINQTSMCADDDGNPYIATYWRDTESDTPQFRLIWLRDAVWQMVLVGNRQLPFTLSGKGTKMVPVSRPRVAVIGDIIYYIFRDKERGSRITVCKIEKHCLENQSFEDLTDFSVDAWEPTIDIELLKNKGQLHIFVQATHQGDGERQSECSEKSTPVYVLEHKKDN